MMKLIYTRIECRHGGTGKMAAQHATRVHKAPAMPDTVTELAPDSWRRVTESRTMEVIESWRLIEAARKVA
jgi:hypothetical protein